MQGEDAKFAMKYIPNTYQIPKIRKESCLPNLMCRGWYIQVFATSSQSVFLPRLGSKVLILHVPNVLFLLSKYVDGDTSVFAKQKVVMGAIFSASFNFRALFNAIQTSSVSFMFITAFKWESSWAWWSSFCRETAIELGSTKLLRYSVLIRHP